MPRYLSVNDRHYEHPVDFRRSEGHAGRIANFKLTDNQIGLIGEQVTDPAKRARVVDAMTDTALRHLHARQSMEFSSLHTLGVDRQSNEYDFQRYLELAGNPEKLGEYVYWFHDLAVRSLNRTQSVSRALISEDNRSLEFEELHRHAYDGTKGPSLELGSAIQAGDWTYSAVLDYWMSTIEAQLASFPGFETKIINSDEVLKRYTIKQPKSEFPIFLRERPCADVISEANTLHIVERSSSLIIGDHADVVQLWSMYEDIIDRGDEDKPNPFILPESKTYYIRMPFKSDA